MGYVKMLTLDKLMSMSEEEASYSGELIHSLYTSLQKVKKSRQFPDGRKLSKEQLIALNRCNDMSNGSNTLNNTPKSIMGGY